MALRGKKPEEKIPRLKALLYGKAGVGKTMAAIQMPKPYIIDAENGCAHYGETIDKRDGAVFASNDMSEVIAECKSLATEPHEFRTLVIDPFTALYETELEKGEREVGNEYGKHYGFASKSSKRLYNILTQLDMNVIVTAHQKKEYESGLFTFDGWKKLDYAFDLVFRLTKGEKKRMAFVEKTRLSEFKDGDDFEWSYDNLAGRYGAERLEKKAHSVALATPEQVDTFRMLHSKLSGTELKRLKLDKLELDEIGDLPSERLAKGIDLIQNYLKK